MTLQAAPPPAPQRQDLYHLTKNHPVQIPYGYHQKIVHNNERQESNPGYDYYYYFHPKQRIKAVWVSLAMGAAIVLLYYWVGDSVWRSTSNNADATHTYLTIEEYSAGFRETVADGQACFTALDCGPGRYCSFPSMHNMSIRICCDEALSLGLDDENDLWLTVCTGASVGEPCGSHHGLCASGHCVHGKCAAAGLKAGRPCPDDGHCASGACGRLDYNTTREATQHCCASGRRLVVDKVADNIPYPVPFCHGSAPEGAPCGGHDELCQGDMVCNKDSLCQPVSGARH